MNTTTEAPARAGRYWVGLIDRSDNGPTIESALLLDAAEGPDGRPLVARYIHDDPIGVGQFQRRLGEVVELTADQVERIRAKTRALVIRRTPVGHELIDPRRRMDYVPQLAWDRPLSAYVYVKPLEDGEVPDRIHGTPGPIDRFPPLGTPIAREILVETAA